MLVNGKVNGKVEILKTFNAYKHCALSVLFCFLQIPLYLYFSSAVVDLNPQHNSSFHFLCQIFTSVKKKTPRENRKYFLWNIVAAQQQQKDMNPCGWKFLLQKNPNFSSKAYLLRKLTVQWDVARSFDFTKQLSVGLYLLLNRQWAQTVQIALNA